MDIIYSDFVILCKEGKSKNSSIVYELPSTPTPDIIKILSLRCRFNTDLNYYVTHKSNIELTRRILENRLLSGEIPENTYKKL